MDIRKMVLAGAAGAAALSSAPQAAEIDENPVTAEWAGPYGGVPAFDTVEVAHFKPALEAAMAAGRADYAAIAGNPEPATFENTIAAMERAGAALNRAYTFYGIWSGSLSTEEMRAIEAEMDPKLSAYSDEIIQNAALFERVSAVYEGEEFDTLSPAEQRLTWDYYTDFVRSGASLSEEDKARVAEINQRLAELYTKFSQNLLHDEEAYVTWLTEDDLAGLPDSLVSAAASAAEGFGDEAEGLYAITNTRSSMDPFLTYSDERALREKVWRTYYDRGDNGDEYDNNAIISEILKLREERSRLQGYGNFAERAIEKQVARTPEAAMGLLMSVWPAALARVEEEVAEMQAIADEEGADLTIAPWDYRYYAEKVRTAKYDLDANEVKEYLQLDNLRDGMFWMAGELYGFDFTEIDDAPVYHEDVRVWKVTDRETGDLEGLWYFDPFARSGKRSGAWMNAYRIQQKLDGEIVPIVSNNSNFVEGSEGSPVLISWDDAETLFHEFGHAIHGLSSDVKYPSQAGTRVPRDFVEFPSQVHERWLATPEVLDRFALHYETGEPMPAELAQKIENAATFRQGFDTVEYLASALIDMRLHTLDDASAVDPDAFERETLDSLGMPDELPMRHRTPQFSHVFSGEGYSAGYYSYLWADAFSADAWEAFEEAGAYDPETAARFKAEILSVGDTRDANESYHAFRGREMSTTALMRSRGFPVTGEDAPAVSGAGETAAPGGGETLD